jgi:prepilin-type N-terminal cleavage/methylation domain-containing protein
MPRLNRRGFTMVELLVTLTLISVLGAVLAQLMMNQQRFYHRTVEQSGVRRELRAAMSILPAEIRSLSSSGGDLTALTPTSIQFRGLIGASIVCAKPGGNVVDLPPTDLAHNVLTTWYTEPVAGDTMYAFDEGLLRGAEDDIWVPLPISSVAATTVPCPGAPYTDPVADAGKQRYRITLSNAVPDSVKVGAGVRFYRHMRYQLSQSTSNKWYLSRSELAGGAWTTPAYMSGPYESPTGGGISFRYFDSTGVEITSVASANSVARVDLTLRASGLAGSQKGQSVPKDSLSFRIALRNRQ